MDDVDGVVELLPLEERVQVIQEELEVVLPASVGNDDGGAVAGLAVGRPVAPPSDDQWVLPLYLSQGQAGREGDMDRTTWRFMGGAGDNQTGRKHHELIFQLPAYLKFQQGPFKSD